MQFVKWCNKEHKHSGIDYVSPDESHSRRDKEILERRQEVYEQVKQEHPERYQKKQEIGIIKKKNG